ncbi:Uncharacterised protein [Kingella potus]|uniref:Uncharacterized protein n=1 Tax=Kingella potus TaxID=265175 RepID=A0A377R3J6_9NEIS|nr:DUF6348 family protein [Kingella potus]STR00881.1 Uncharacterised protein [Kingella potus]
MNEETDYTLNQILHAAFTAHGCRVREEHGKLIPDLKIPAAFDTLAHITGRRPNAVITRLDVETTLPDGRSLYEAYGDIGATVEEALSGNWENFQESAFHTLLNALDGKHGTAERWTLGGIPFHAHAGPALLKYAGEKPALPADALHTAIREALHRIRPEKQIHFVRFYYSQSANQTDCTEFLLDNQSHPAAEQALARLDWPERSHFYSLRRFIVLVPEEEAV